MAIKCIKRAVDPAVANTAWSDAGFPGVPGINGVLSYAGSGGVRNAVYLHDIGDTSKPQIGKRIQVPAGTQMIAIAEDSPWQCVDMYIGGRKSDYFRIAVGAPFVGTLIDDYIIVCLPNGFEQVLVAGADQYLWETFPVPGTGDIQFLTSAVPPIRLNFYTGLQGFEPLPLVRAPLIAQLACHANNTLQQDFAFQVVTDGRRRWSFNANLIKSGGTDGTVDLSLVGYSGQVQRLGSADSSTRLSKSLQATAGATLDASGVDFQYEFEGAPFQSILFTASNLSQANATYRVAIHVEAYDD